MLRMLTALGALLLSAAPALANAAKEEPNILEMRFDLTIWSIVIFALLFLVLRKFAWNPILQGLHKREHSITDAIEESRRTREEMAQLKAEFDRKMHDMQQQIPLLLEKAHRDGEALKSEMKAQADAEINASRQRLRKELDTARDQILSELFTQAANVATLISAKAIRKSLDGADHRRLVDESLAELKIVGTQAVQENAGLGSR